MSSFCYSDDLETLSVKQLKEILMLNRVDFKGCCEKNELKERVERLWHDHVAAPRKFLCQDDRKRPSIMNIDYFSVGEAAFGRLMQDLHGCAHRMRLPRMRSHGDVHGMRKSSQRMSNLSKLHRSCR